MEYLNYDFKESVQWTGLKAAGAHLGNGQPGRGCLEVRAPAERLPQSVP